tara:strand:- start:2256 stop:2804 length:549 start_codon:yes stop_codon:yes gene_type:complete
MKNKFVKFLFSGDPKVVALKIIVLGVIAYLSYRIIKNTLDRTTEESISQTQNSIIEAIDNGSVQTNDGSQQAPNSDQVQLNEIALQQYTLMNQFLVDEQALFDSLKNLNGSQLQAVYVAYGVKDNKNLFQWYNDTLNSSYLTGGATAWTYTGEDSTECNSQFDFCSELDVMKLVWAKSGLTF